MKLLRRKRGSQRSAAPIAVEMWPNSVGQCGDACLTLRTADGDWIILAFETDAEVRELMSQSQIIFRNMPDEKI
jgi:hypothetical protein